MAKFPKTTSSGTSKKTKWIVGGCIVAAVLAAVILFIGLQPSEEVKNVLKAINSYGEVQEHNGHVEKVTWLLSRGPRQ